MADTPLIGAVRLFSPNGKFTQTEVDHLLAVEASFRAREIQADIAPKVVGGRTGLTDPAAFFDQARAKHLLGPLDQDEVDGCSALLLACGNAGWPIGDTAYAFGTTFHETAGTMQPIKEYGGPSYFFRMYDPKGSRPKVARELGNVHDGDGARFFGRGYVQLTGRRNYVRATAALQGEFPGIDLVANPDFALRLPVAAAIMVRGMSEGWFTSRDLDDDIPREGLATLQQFVKSRDIINGTDKADKIAREAMAFQTALEAGGWCPC